MKQKEIAEKTGLSKGRITQIVSESNSLEVKHESSINTTTPSAEIESLQRKLDEAEAARRSTEQRLSAVQSVPSSGRLSRIGASAPVELSGNSGALAALTAQV